ncbi:Phosphatidylinositol-4-phosphate 5-kinase, partial [Physocladia obscura]
MAVTPAETELEAQTQKQAKRQSTTGYVRADGTPIKRTPAIATITSGPRESAHSNPNSSLNDNDIVIYAGKEKDAGIEEEKEKAINKEIGSKDTEKKRPVYNVWEQSDKDGHIVEEVVEVNLSSHPNARRHLSVASARSRHNSTFLTSMPRPKRGTLVNEGHANYLLMYDMLTGIRVSVSRCHARPNRELDDTDFKAAHKLAFDVTGNEMLPKATYDFKFKDYAPW